MAEQLLKSAVANAKVKKMDEESLYISDIRADGGPIMKRFMSRSMGRADRLLKRTSHLSITLEEKQTAEQAQAVEAVAEKPAAKKAAAKKESAKKTVKKPAKKTAVKAKK